MEDRLVNFLRPLSKDERLRFFVKYLRAFARSGYAEAYREKWKRYRERGKARRRQAAQRKKEARENSP